MWVIENGDQAGIGLFICEAATKEKAIELHNQACSGMSILSIERVLYLSLAEHSDARGLTAYSAQVVRIMPPP